MDILARDVRPLHSGHNKSFPRVRHRPSVEHCGPIRLHRSLLQASTSLRIVRQRVPAESRVSPRSTHSCSSIHRGLGPSHLVLLASRLSYSPSIPETPFVKRMANVSILPC